MFVPDETKNPLVIHLGLVLAEAICASAFYVEIRRAIDGNRLSWAYVFEWPIFAAYAIYVWKKLLSDERRPPRSQAPTEPTSTVDARVDESLDAYNDFLRRVHHREPGDEGPGPTND